MDAKLSKKILVVDDEECIREMLQEFFEAQGHLVETAHSGIEAIKKLKDHFFDVLLTDMRMPEGSGIELLEQVHRDQILIPLKLVMTGFVEEAPEKLSELGVKHIFDKPLNFFDIHKKIIEYLE